MRHDPNESCKTSVHKIILVETTQKSAENKESWDNLNLISGADKECYSEKLPFSSCIFAFSMLTKPLILTRRNEF